MSGYVMAKCSFKVEIFLRTNEYQKKGVGLVHVSRNGIQKGKTMTRNQLSRPYQKLLTQQNYIYLS